MSVHISRTVALALIKTASELFLAGSGVHIDHENEEMIEQPGLIDEINPENSELFYWANELLRFSRLVHGLMSHALREAQEDL